MPINESYIIFLIENVDLLFEIAFAVISTASLVAAVTPTPRDDIIIGKLYRVVETLALNVGHAKETPPNRVQDPSA
jgi:hypothetical protein